MRVAAAQFAVLTDVSANLATVLRMIDQAAECKPDVIVLPEFCNHCAWYPDQEYAYDVGVDLQGDFVAAVATKAKAYGCYIMLNCTVRREYPKLTVTNILLGPQGQIVATSDKQTLMGNENNFATRATALCPIIDTPHAKLGMYSCMDGVIPETARGLALRGAQVLLNSLNSFAHDEADLHIPVRAAENKVFVVSACKSGSLVPAEMTKIVAQRLKVAPEFVQGAGDSQIIAPDGTVLARAPKQVEAVIWADIDPNAANDKTWPDGTDSFATRRPALYKPIAQKPSDTPPTPPAAPQIKAAAFQVVAEDEVVYGGRLRSAITDGAKLLVLPELAFLSDGVVTDIAAAQHQSTEFVAMLRRILQGSDVIIATSVVENGAHVGVLIDANGICLRQPQLHLSQRHAWHIALGDGVCWLDTAWGRLAVLPAADALYPETCRLLALQGVNVLAVCTHVQAAWETQYGLPERAAENRINAVIATRLSGFGTSRVCAASPDFTLWAEWSKPFDGNISTPDTLAADLNSAFVIHNIYPAASANRFVSQKTNLVDGRPWWLCGPIVAN